MHATTSPRRSHAFSFRGQSPPPISEGGEWNRREKGKQEGGFQHLRREYPAPPPDHGRVGAGIQDRSRQVLCTDPPRVVVGRSGEQPRVSYQDFEVFTTPRRNLDLRGPGSCSLSAGTVEGSQLFNRILASREGAKRPSSRGSKWRRAIEIQTIRPTLGLNSLADVPRFDLPS